MPRQVARYNPYMTPGSSGMRGLARYAAHSAGRAVRRQLFKKTFKQKSRSRTAYASTPHQNPLNAQAKKASMKRKGSKNTRSIVHRKKRVRVSKPLRAKIKKVIAGTAIKGSYYTTRFGTIGITTNGNGGTTNIITKTEAMGGYTGQTAYQQRNKDVDGNARFWFAHALQSTDTGASDAEKLEQGSEWQFFTLLKIIDAASVLWNTKDADRNYGIQIGNLNTVHTSATGVPVVGTVANPAIKGLKIHVQNAYVKFKIKNNSQRSMQICVYNVVPKIRFPLTTALEGFLTAVATEADGANSAYVSSVNDQFTNFQQNASLFANPLCEPNMFPSFNRAFKYEKITIKIAPGETCEHSVQGPKNFDLDFSKLYNAGIDESERAYSKTSMFVMMSVQPDLAYAETNVSTATTGGRSGYYVPGFAAKNTVADPISIHWDEVYHLAMPEIVGFTTAAGFAGTEQILNQRIRRRAFGNFTSVNLDTDTNPGYTAFEEENPVTGIASGVFN